ncbi:MAG: helix-turn-helix domain-containing protein [Cytophagales bacterium]|nr:helix-turn-helix domain-containing protein [Cytophagales bacterium]
MKKKPPRTSVSRQDRVAHVDEVVEGLTPPKLYIYDNETFHTFDLFQETVYKWQLDFRLMSKNGFYSDRTSLITDKIIINLSYLHGKVVQYGLCPRGYRTFVVPASTNQNFYWLKRKVNGNQLLVFPENGTLDGVSFDGFQVFTISISNSHLEAMLEKLRYEQAKKILGKNEVAIRVSDVFVNSFTANARRLLHSGAANTIVYEEKLYNTLISELPIVLLKEFENNKVCLPRSKSRQRDRALSGAIDIIEAAQGVIVKVEDICERVGVSERTLEYAFKEKYSVSPKTFINGMMFNKVRKELRRGASHKISDVAAKYGFWHMGQFAADYRTWFGELPSDTIKKSQKQLLNFGGIRKSGFDLRR